MALKYKVGNKVRIKSIDWYNENKDEFDMINCGERCFTHDMISYCGKILTVSYIIESEGCYEMADSYFRWTDEMIEGLVEEDITDVDKFQDNNEIINIINEYVHHLEGNECQINLPEGYQFTDEDGNVINTTTIVLEKKKKEYPKTYEECSLINGCENRIPLKIIGEFTKLINARNAYWKISGKEMGLGKPWKPDWSTKYEIKYVIEVYCNNVRLNSQGYSNAVLAFPTKEMRDAFYENFKELIEQCKELL